MIIGFSGWPGVGKSVLVNHVMDGLPEYTKMSFGDSLKQAASEAFNYPLEWNYSQEGKERAVEIINWPYPAGRSIKVMKVREILLWYGSEYLLVKNPAALVERAQFNMGKKRNVVFDDVRDPLEANFIRSTGGSLLRIEPYESWRPGTGMLHPREHLLDEYKCWDSLLYPKFGTLKEFSKQVIQWIRDHE